MLFDLNPKEKTADLFDRKKELAELLSATERGERLIVVYGIRRIGKTSLLKSFIYEKEFLSVFLDVRKIYFVHRKSVPSEAIYESLMEGFTELLNELGISAEEQIRILSVFQGYDITSLLSNINRWCSEKRARFLFILDEAQYLRFSKRVAYDGVIAWSMDNLKNIIFIVSGSEVGLLKEVLNYDDVKAPLYGRLKNEITLKKLNSGESREFLMRGFKEQNEDITEEQLVQVFDSVGGLIGWLTYYGYYRTVRRLSHKAALAEVFSEGSKISMAEVDTLVKGSKKRYLAIMTAISNGICSWSEIKAYTMARSGRIPDSVLDKLISSLIKFSIIEKDSDGKYKIIDPILKSHLQEDAHK